MHYEASPTRLIPTLRRSGFDFTPSNWCLACRGVVSDKRVCKRLCVCVSCTRVCWVQTLCWTTVEPVVVLTGAGRCCATRDLFSLPWYAGSREANFNTNKAPIRNPNPDSQVNTLERPVALTVVAMKHVCTYETHSA